MRFTDIHPELPGLGDVAAAVARVANRAPALAQCPVDHVALCVESGNLARYRDHVRRCLPEAGIREYRAGDPDAGMQVVEIRDATAGVHLVLAAPSGSRGQLADFLAATGAEGLQHIAFAVPDAEAMVRDLLASGLPFVGGDPALAIVEAREGENLLRQAFTEPLFGAFFVEVIERRGIVEMRPANIDALYALKAQCKQQSAQPA